MGSICLGVSFDFGVCAAADLQLAVHGEYTGGFANKRGDDSVCRGEGKLGTGGRTAPIAVSALI